MYPRSHLKSSRIFPLSLFFLSLSLEFYILSLFYFLVFSRFRSFVTESFFLTVTIFMHSLDCFFPFISLLYALV